MIEAQEMTRGELADALHISEWTLQRALDQLNIVGKRSDPTDRRKVLFPSDTLDRIREWLEKTS